MIAIRESKGETQGVRFSPMPDDASLMALNAPSAMNSLTTASVQTSLSPLATTSPLTVPLSWPLLIKQTKSHVTSIKPTPLMTKKLLKYRQTPATKKALYWREAQEGELKLEE